MSANASARLAIQDVHRSVRFSAFLLVFCGALSLALTQRMIIPAMVLVAAELIAWTWPKPAGWGSFWEIASFAYLLFFILDLFRISGSLAPALVHLFAFILVNKLFNLKSQRDYHQLYLLTFLTILAATSLSAEIEMFYMIVLYIIVLVWNIVSLTLYSEWKESQEAYFPFSFFSPYYLAGILAASSVAFVIALGIFFLLPRMQLGFLGGLKQDKVQYISGFSQKVSLGDINNIQADPDVAMRVRVTSAKEVLLPPRLYWRGIAFDHYDGKSWSSTAPGTRFLFRDSSSTYYASAYAGDLGALIHQEFYMEPIDTRVIFSLDRAVRIHGTFGQISRDPNGTFTGMGRVPMYDVWSRYVPPSLDGLRHGPDEIPDGIRRYYLQLPARSQQIAGLAGSITASSRTTIDRALAIKTYLQKNFAYSTTTLPKGINDPIADFLFVTRKGHCEYFASSMALLLRYIGIPARLVNGFREGEFNPIGGFYVVRNSDAHSWVEAFVGGQWISFDPSPIDEGEATGSIGSILNVRKILDSIGFFWDRYILIFSGQDQIDAVLGFRDRYHEIRDKFTGAKHAEGWNDRIRSLWRENRSMLAAISAGIILVVLAFRLFMRRRRRVRVSRSPVLFYQEMLTILARKGFQRPPQSTPAEFVKAIEPGIPVEERPVVTRLTDLFYKARFGGYTLSSSDQNEVRDSLRRLESW